MKKIIAGGVTSLLLAGGIVVGGVLPANAAENATPVSSRAEAPEGTVWTDGVVDNETCLVTDIGVHTAPGAHHDAVYEDVVVVDKEAWDETVTTKEAWDELIPATYKTIHHDALTHVEYHFAKFTRERSGEKHRGSVDWSDWSDWTLWQPVTHTSWELNTDPIGSPQPHAEWTEGRGNDKVYFERQWQARYDGTQRTVTDKKAWDEKVVDVPEHTVHHDAVTEVVHHDAVTHIETRLVSEAYDEDDVVTTYSYTHRAEGCTVAPNPQAVINATCGATDVTLTNPGDINKTASFIVNVDGDFYGAYAVLADGSETVSLTFPEDSGDHSVQVYQAGISEYKLIAEATVASDCAVNVPEQPDPTSTTTSTEDVDCEAGTVTTTTTTTTTTTVYDAETNTWIAGDPIVETASSVRDVTVKECPLVTPDEPKAPTKALVAKVSDDVLATTGGAGPNPILLGIGLSALIAGIGAATFKILLNRRKASQE